MWIVTIATIYLVHGTTFAIPGGGNLLTSANFPNMYPNNEDTVQTLSVPGGYNMLITFQEFELETHGSCAYDYVQICDENNLCGKKFCGSSLPDPITVSTSTATVKFHSDGSVSRKGFSLTYKKIRPEVAAFSIGGGPSALEGNVFFGGRPICDDYWDNTDAGVFCRMMGYQNGNATSGSKYGQVSSDFSMDDVRCNGHETHLIDCNHTTQHNCGSSEGAGVICSGDSAFSISGGPSSFEGNIFFGGRPICDDEWDNTDAGVFCRMMGYQNGNATYRSTYGQVSSDFSMDDVLCNGHETNLLDCNHTTQQYCGSSKGAGVICSDNVADVEIVKVGDGEVHQLNRMGVYVRTNQEIRGRPVYEQKVQKLNDKQFLFVGPNGNWRVGPNIESWLGTGLKNKLRTQTPPKTGWQYWDGQWINDSSIQLREVSQEHGNKLTSTNFPNIYPNNEDTVQTLSVPGGYNMLITFQEFQLEIDGSCAYDYVQICDENNLCGNKLCGTSLPDSITVTTSTATVVFHSDGDVSMKGFSLTYKKIRPVSQCSSSSYTVLNEDWRKIDYYNREVKSSHCDSNMTKGWYRLQGAAGTQLPTSPAPNGTPSSSRMYCGTHATAYITGGEHPTPEEGIVSRGVCFEWNNNTCWKSQSLKVAACYGDDDDVYYIYELSPPGYCLLAYCALDGIGQLSEESDEVIYISGGSGTSKSSELVDVAPSGPGCGRVTGELPARRYGHSMHLIDVKKIVICGGGWDSKSCIVASSPSGPWSYHSTTTDERYYHGSCTIGDPLGGAIHLIGGFRASMETWKVYRWKTNSNPPVHFGGGTCATNIGENEILVIGGGDGANNKVALYQVKEDKWEELGEVPIGRGRLGHGCISMGDGQVLVGGGSEEGNRLRSSGIYHIGEGRWEDVGDMKSIRSDVRFVALHVAGKRRFYALGGHDGSKRLGSIEEFDKKTKTWSVSPVRMAEGRNGFAAVVLKKKDVC